MEEEVKRMDRKIFYVSLVALLMLFAASPALASQPKITITVGLVQYPDPANPGMSFTTNDIVHGRDKGSIGPLYGLPWGTLTQAEISNYELNKVTWTGTGIIHYSVQNSIAAWDGVANVKFNGLTTPSTRFFYHGPTLSAIGRGNTPVTISDGMSFAGVLFSGIAVAQGTADGRDIQVRTTFAGVSIVGSSVLAGIVISAGTITYWYTGN